MVKKEGEKIEEYDQLWIPNTAYETASLIKDYSYCLRLLAFILLNYAQWINIKKDVHTIFLVTKTPIYFGTLHVIFSPFMIEKAVEKNNFSWAISFLMIIDTLMGTPWLLAGFSKAYDNFHLDISQQIALSFIILLNLFNVVANGLINKTFIGCKTFSPVQFYKEANTLLFILTYLVCVQL